MTPGCIGTMATTNVYVKCEIPVRDVETLAYRTRVRVPVVDKGGLACPLVATGGILIDTVAPANGDYVLALLPVVASSAHVGWYSTRGLDSVFMVQVGIEALSQDGSMKTMLWERVNPLFLVDENGFPDPDFGAFTDPIQPLVKCGVLRRGTDTLDVQIQPLPPPALEAMQPHPKVLKNVPVQWFRDLQEDVVWLVVSRLRVVAGVVQVYPNHPGAGWVDVPNSSISIVGGGTPKVPCEWPKVLP